MSVKKSEFVRNFLVANPTGSYDAYQKWVGPEGRLSSPYFYSLRAAIQGPVKKPKKKSKPGPQPKVKKAAARLGVKAPVDFAAEAKARGIFAKPLTQSVTFTQDQLVAAKTLRKFCGSQAEAINALKLVELLGT